MPIVAGFVPYWARLRGGTEPVKTHNRVSSASHTFAADVPPVVETHIMRLYTTRDDDRKKRKRLYTTRADDRKKRKRQP